MDSRLLVEELKKIEGLELGLDVPLKEYTSFRIGGPADIFLVPLTQQALIDIISLISRYRQEFFILGKGSNLVISDRGIRGIVLYTGKLNKIETEANLIRAESGITLAALANRAMEAGLSGLEFASGIPGSLGGAIYMNAGAYGGEMKDVVTAAQLLDYSGQTLTLAHDELGFSYRHSILQEESFLVLEVEMKLKSSQTDDIKARIQELNSRRKEKQPLEWPSAGSMFKRPQGHYTGPLIEKAGLKGLRVGDAQVSEKHAGFIINLGNATSSDVIQLIKKVQKEVYRNSGVHLEVEPRFVGEFTDSDSR